MRIGLFGGTFNPVHLGHLRAAEEIRELFNLERVIFIPAHLSPHKQRCNLALPHHRLKMLEYAIDRNPYFATSDVEIRRAGRSYSVDTLRHFRKSLPGGDETFFIMGVDAFLEVDSWKSCDQLFALSNVIVMTRPGYVLPGSGQILPPRLSSEFTAEQEGKRYLHASGHALVVASISALDISSGAIRKLVAAGRSVAYLVPAAVEDYIKDTQLYQRSAEGVEE